MKYVPPFAAGVIFLILAAVRINAALVVNEALVNEPSDSVTLEWFELYNDSDGPVNLTFFQAQIGSSDFLLEGTLMPHNYAVVCRDSSRFVDRWVTDISAVDYRIIERSFMLTNSSGIIQLYRLTTLETALSWSETGVDGVSWERVLPELTLIQQSADISGSTPGRVNSVTPLPVDLTLLEVSAARIDDGASVTFTIGNTGRTTVTDGLLTVFLLNPDNPTVRDSTILSLTIPPIDTGFTVVIGEVITLPGYYAQLEASLADDDRPENNALDFFVPGTDFPPVVLNEFLANPVGRLTTEWIELYNRSDSNLDISNWSVGDLINSHLISGSPVVLESDNYVVLTDDSTAFLQYYDSFDGLLIQPSGWPALNNTGDIVRLSDGFGFSAVAFEYSTVYDSNFTWSRSQIAGVDNDWGRSSDVGGTPGEQNLVRIQPSETGLHISITPQVFSPDGDGQDDEAMIVIDAPSSSQYTLKVYDRQGRIVKTFEEKSAFLAEGGVYRWDGRADSGNRLPIGIYILFFEAGGVESLKKTLVIAR